MVFILRITHMQLRGSAEKGKLKIVIIYVFHDWNACSVSGTFVSKMLAMQANKILLEILFCLFLRFSASLGVEFCPAT